MANNRIGCNSGKTKFVDPNLFDGQNSSDNISVPLEDLSIYVQLETNKKARTLLKTENTVVGIKNTNESSNKINLTFIEGSLINGEKVLTTNYSDLTTSLSDDTNSESFGITNIDIDFNSSYAPLITINFLDLRGSAIFQREEFLKNGENKYSTLFQLPYPIFQLTIKGHYGMPVKYCLHMTKFNAKFNSQTGNFEITANFIGYTYAMLSDMLLGYLKAIPYTTLGSNAYVKINKERVNNGFDPILTLDELMVKISNINVGITKISETDQDNIQIKNGNNKLLQLDNIKNIIDNLAKSIRLKTTNDDETIVDKNIFILVGTNTINTTATLPLFSNLITDNNEDLANYNTNITEALKTYNEINEFRLDGNNFTYDELQKNLYKALTKKMIFSSQDDLDNTDNNKLRAILLKNVNGVYDFKTFDGIVNDLQTYITKNYSSIGDNIPFDIYDLRNQYSLIKTTKTTIEDFIKILKKSFANTIRETVTDILKFEPTVRNIINIFTTAVDVFVSVLFDVSSTAINDDNRKKQLSRFTNNGNTNFSFLDYKKNTTDNIGSFSPIFFPWPDYIHSDETEGLVDKYLGENGVLDIPSDVNELKFIDELFNGFLKSKTNTDQTALENNLNLTNWFPINPIDTRLFINSFPYKRISANSKEEVIELIMLRAMTYLGYSNRGVSSLEIEAMANAEADSVLNNIVNDKVKDSLSKITINDFLSIKGSVNGIKTNLVQEFKDADVDDFYYTYIFNEDIKSLERPVLLTGGATIEVGSPHKQKIIPINGDFNAIWSPNISSLKDKQLNGSIFLTNYDAGALKFSSGGIIPTKRLDDGGIYVKIIDKTVYSNNSIAQPLPNTNLDVTPILNLEKLKQDFKSLPIDGSGIGFNQFGGTYGTQEFTKLNYGGNLGEKPFMYVFYQNGNFGTKTYNKSNGFGLHRLNSGINNKTTTSDFDITPNSKLFQVANSFGEIIPFIDGDKALHGSYGKNRELITDTKSISYPYINFQVEYGNAGDGNDLAPISLFGSRFYYEQIDNKVKALLYLHTLPFNGLITDNDNNFSLTANDIIFDKNEILNTFANRAGFVSAPKQWVAFIGGMLWRAESDKDPILFGNGIDSFIPTFNNTTPIPTKEQFLYKRVLTTSAGRQFPGSPMTFSSNRVFGGGDEYVSIGGQLLRLPEQVKNEFKQVFFDFVNFEFFKIKSELEIFSGTGSEWVTAYNNIISSATTSNNKYFLPLDKTKETYTVINNGVNNFDNYIVFTPILFSIVTNKQNNINFDAFKYNYILELKDNTQANKTLMDMFVSEMIIVNTSYKIWGGNNFPGDPSNNLTRSNIKCSSTDLTHYINTIITKFTPKTTVTNNNTKENELQIFGTTDENVIKLQLYKTCKNIYDKWIGDTDSKDVTFQGACSGRNAIDFELAKKNGGSSTPALIDSFRFVDRSFKDIGDELFINPIPVNEYLRNNPNSSFYDGVTNLLSSNNFDFIPLPAFINYNDDETLQNLFKPISTIDSIKSGAIGPSFVCVYIGNKSKNLDFKGSEYPNDGFDFGCDNNGNLSSNVPKDFKVDSQPYENNVPVFAVNYSQQNQNIFKDITLDQSEFSETDESLKIIDDISKKGAENNRTFAGQNIYNVYSVRSYKTEVEMMGNAMIQPMMYFQLNNIPMFHGAYMITHVKHNIKPNSMSTHFTGVRIRSTKTKLIDANELFMSLLNAIDSTSVSANSTTLSFGSTIDGTINNPQLAIPPIDISTLFVNPYAPNPDVKISSSVGQRVLDGKVNTHKGVDFTTQYGSDLVSIYDGVIEKIKYQKGGFGLYMVINHGIQGKDKKVYKSVYGHFSDIDKNILDLTILTKDNINNLVNNGINPNNIVKKGQVIGKSGGQQNKRFLDSLNKRFDLAGHSTAPHLHYELRVGDENELNTDFLGIPYVNPIPYLPVGLNPPYKFSPETA